MHLPPHSARARCLVALVALALTAPARATLLRRLPLAAVTQQAERVVQATVLEVRSGRDDSGLPATWITLDVARTIKGPAARRLTMKQYGTAEPLPDGTASHVAGMPTWKVGDEVVLFLRAESRRGFTSPVGFAQGAYRVRRDAGRAQVRGEDRMNASRDLDDFVDEVSRLAGAPR
jgi:hypothetical protein